MKTPQMNRRLYMSKQKRTVFLACAIAALLGALFTLFRYSAGPPMTETDVLYGYSVSVEGKYEVGLAINSLYPSGILEEGRIYSPRLAETLKMNFHAALIGTAPAKVSGEYMITAVVQGYQSSKEERKVIYERTDTLVEPREMNKSTDSAEATEEVIVELAPYKVFSEQAEAILGAKPSKDLRILFSGTFFADTEFGRVEEPFAYAITVPLSNDLFTIVKQEPIQKADAISKERQVRGTPALFPLLLTIFWAGLAAAAMVFLFVFVRKPSEDECRAIACKEVLRRHGSRMAKVEDLKMILTGCEIPIADIDSLVRLSDELGQPILMKPDESGLPEDGILCVPYRAVQYVLYLKR